MNYSSNTVIDTWEIIPRVFHLSFETQYELNASFLRLQEFYESPEFKGVLFTLEDFMDWYVTTTTNNQFSYYTDWDGCNVPGNIVKSFLATFGHANDLSNKERHLIWTIEAAVGPEAWGSGEFYIIGTFSDPNCQNDAIRHELSHAMWAMCDEYRTEQLNHMGLLHLDLVERMISWLNDNGYHPDVHDDEIVAYLATSSITQIGEQFIDDGFDAFPWDVVYKFQQTFNKHSTNIS